MSSLLVAFLLVLIVPLLLSSWRARLVGLSAQGLLMGWMVLERAQPSSPGAYVLLVDLLVVRGLLVPLFLYRILREAPRRNDVLPANLLSWALAGALLLIAFRFGKLVAGGDVHLATHVSVAAAGVLFALLILATQDVRLSQLVGFLRLENAIALFELASPELPPMPIQVGLLLVFVLTVITFGTFLRRFEAQGAAPASSPEEQTL